MVFVLTKRRNKLTLSLDESDMRVLQLSVSITISNGILVSLIIH